MPRKSTYEELEQRVRELEKEAAERKQVEKALRESEERFRQFFENEQEFCYMISPEGLILNVNRAALEILGYKKSQLIGKPLKMIYAPEVLPKIKELFAKWREIGNLKDEELIIITKRGDRRTVLLSSSVVRDREGKILHSVSVQKDITERRHAEEALKKSERKYRDIFENVSDFLYVHDLEGNFTETNLAFKKKEYGFTGDDLANLNIKDLLPEQYKNQFEGYLERVKAKGTDEGFMSVMTKDGRERIVEYRNSIVYDAKGPIGVRGSARDITERRRAEEASRRAAALETLTSVLQNFIGDSLANLLCIVYSQLELCGLSSNIDQLRSNITAATQGLTKLIQGTHAYQDFSSLTKDSLGGINSVALRSILEPLLSGKPLQTYQKKCFPIESKVKLRFAYDPEHEGALSWEELPSVSGSKQSVATALQETMINAVESYDPEKDGDVVISAIREEVWVKRRGKDLSFHFTKL
jgi:PAS domain S-box-containing protein